MQIPIYNNPRAAVAPVDELAARTLLGLRTPISDGPRGGVVMSIIGAVLTFGLYPALFWPLRFQRVIDGDRNRLGQLAEWIRASRNHPDVPRLRLAADRLRFRPLLYLVGLAACAAWVLAGFYVIAHSARINLVVMPATYEFQPRQLTMDDWVGQIARNGPNVPIWVARTAIFALWTGGLSIAFCAHWLQVQLHARSVRQYLDVLNRILMQDALPPVFLSPVGTGLRPIWAVGALVMAAINAPWGIPMMFAGAVQRRYVLRVGPQMRAALAARSAEMLGRPRPAPPPVAVAPQPPPKPFDGRPRCSTDGCRLPLPAGAKFCPRCGKRAMPRVDRVA